MLVIESPKRSADTSSGFGETYSYYAGYSLRFAEQLLEHLPRNSDSLVLDPWNGSGTTTVAAARAGYPSVGFDLNPVMVVVAKARMLRPSTYPSILPIWDKIKAECIQCDAVPRNTPDPLRDWFDEVGIRAFRTLEKSIKSHLVIGAEDRTASPLDYGHLSDLAAFFYISLFRVARRLTTCFRSSNPTWLRRPRTEAERVSIRLRALLDAVDEELHHTLASQDRRLIADNSKQANSHLSTCSSERLNLPGNSIDVVLTSPPYCTRIDYAVATSVELAVLGYERKTTFAVLRDSLMGTTTVPKVEPPINRSLGQTCRTLLKDISEHNSVASNTYYLKNHIQYFVSLQKSISEITRVLRPWGMATFVVQDSVYKDVHNDLPAIVTEMCRDLGLRDFQRDDFPTGASIASINMKSRRYKPVGFKPTESVISFYKHP